MYDYDRSYEISEADLTESIQRELANARYDSLPVAPAYIPPATTMQEVLEVQASLLPRGWATVNPSRISLQWPIGDDPDDYLVDTLLDAIGPYNADTKEAAPCLIPSTFKDGRGDRASCRVSDVDNGTMLCYDIDRGGVTADQIRNIMQATKLSCIFYHTWSSGAASGERWRILLPLSAPIPARVSYPEVWKRLARILEDLLADELGISSARLVQGQVQEQYKTGILDYLPSPVQKHILPCFPTTGRGSDKYPWGGTKPKPEFIPGIAVPVDIAKLNAQGVGERTSRSRPRGQKSGKAIPDVKPYVPNANADHITDTVYNLQPYSAKVPGVYHALDCIQHMVENGVTVEAGMRHNTLLGAVWHMYRLGFTPEDMEASATRMVLSTINKKNQSYLSNRLDEIVGQWVAAAGKAERLVSPAYNATRDSVLKQHRDLYRRYISILARHDHIVSGAGGKIDHASLAKMLGLQVEAIVKMRSILIEAGFLTMQGEGIERIYRWSSVH